MAVFADPTGAALCLWEPRANIGATLVNTPGVDDLERPRHPGSRGRGRLLRRALRLDVRGDAGLRRLPRDPQRRAQQRRHHAADRTMGRAATGCPYFGHDDVERLVGEIDGLGGQALQRPDVQVPQGTFAVLADPQGAVFAALTGPVRRLSAPRPPSRAGRRPRRGAARRCSPTRRPTRSRAEVVAVPTRGMERWLTQRLSTGSARRPGARTASARTSTSRPRAGWSATRSRRPRASTRTDPWLPERAVWPLLEVVDDVARRAVAAARSPRTSAADDRARAGSRPCATSPTCSTATRCTGRRWSAPGRRATTPASRPTPPGRPSCGGGCATRIGEPDPAERLERACARLRERARRSSTCPRASRCSASPGCRAGHLEVLRALAAAPRRPPVPPAPVARAVGAGRRRRRAGRPPPRGPDRDAARTTACSPPGARTRASCSSCSRRPSTPTTTTRSTHRERHAARAASRPTCARTAAARPTSRRRRCSTRPTAASRSTPATAARARSRCCATRSCTCSPTTRRSSRATSSSCARTSRRSRR